LRDKDEKQDARLSERTGVDLSTVEVDIDGQERIVRDDRPRVLNMLVAVLML